MSPLQEIVNLIAKSESVLLVTHAQPDGDGLSAILALSRALNKLGKKTAAVSADSAPDMLHFLPSLDQLETGIAGATDMLIELPLGSRNNAEVTSKIVDGKLMIFVRPVGGTPFDPDEARFDRGKSDFDLIVVCDTPELPLLGSVFESNPEIFYETPVINIDHHPSNNGFGRVNLVDVTAASTTEVIVRLVQALEAETSTKLWDPEIATLLLTGIITDTGSFQNANTTPRSFEVSADLIAHGARQQEIIHHVYKTKKLTTLKLWGRVLSKIEFDPEHRLVWSTITATDLTETGADEIESTGIIDELMTNAPGAEVVLLLKQNGGVKGSLRTTTPSVSANEIAGIWGGGGHLRAAGFKLADRKVEECAGEVVAKIRAYQAARLNLVSDTTTPANIAEPSQTPTTEKETKPSFVERVKAAARKSK